MPSPLIDLPPALAGSRLARPGAWRWARWAVLSLAVLALVGLLATGGSQPAEPRLARGPAVGSRVAGFDEATVSVVEATPSSAVPAADHCTLLATTQIQRQRGLMGRKDLAGYDGMAFRFDVDVTTTFYNRGVPMALSVAWFDAAGRWVGTKDLETCPDVDGCPTIASPGPYRLALEVEKGGLSRLGLGVGSRIGVTPGC